MVETLSSGLEAPPACLHNGLAETAPEPALAVTPDSTIIKPTVDIDWVYYPMLS